jgi:UDP-N-acetylglucosamine:LPS N-acetylglucosamine transferase
VSGRSGDRLSKGRQSNGGLPGAPESALVRSGSIGKGHDSVAEACRAALADGGVDGRVLDCMAMLGGPQARAGMAAFRRMLEIPSVYDGFHFSHLRSGTWLPRALERGASRRLVPALRRELDALAGYPLVVSVFPTGVTTSARLKEERPAITAVAVCTDACAHRLWVADGIDLYIVCSSLAANTVRRYQPGAAIAVVPPPVRPAFYRAPDRVAARDALGMPADAPCVLLMAGGWGLGPLAETAEALAGAGYWVLAVAGLNDGLRRRLDATARRFPTVRPFGLTDRVPELMAAADAVVTSPGQTCHEARVVGRWLVILDVVPGHGRENALHELEQGGALACSPDPASVVGAVRVMFAEQPEHPPWPVETAAAWNKHFAGALAGAGVALPTDR